MSDKPRHFSMIRDFHLADALTLANGFAGMGALLALIKFQGSGDRTFLWIAFVLFPVALVCDVLDGRVARKSARGSSPLGQELDSLADVVSFGVAPAACGFVLGLQGGWDALALTYFVACGISRLARYNVTASTLAGPTGKVKYYEGTPIPTSLAIVALWAWFASRGLIGDAVPGGRWELGPWGLHPLSLIYAASGSAMISKTLRIPKP
jgi:CDP-diacylglycerol---serine O-phosphatidyltransferase